MKRSNLKNLKVALVHDDLVQWGGAERVFAEISSLFPEAPIYTSVFDKSHPILAQKFKSQTIITSFLQKFPFWKSSYKALLPLYPLAFEQFNFDDFDLVISHTTRFAKVIITKPETLHICYTHTPPRFLWNYNNESPKFFQKYFNYLKDYDQVTSNRVDYFLTGSKNAQGRVKDVYNRESEVVYPFVDLEKYRTLNKFSGGYLLVIGRLNKYKRIDLVVQAAIKLGLELKIVGVGPEAANLQTLSYDSNTQFLGLVDEETLNNLLAGCRALVVAGEEDFGLTPLEAMACGKPVVAYKKGGAMETVIDQVTGHFFETQTVESLAAALVKLERWEFNPNLCLKQAEKFSKDHFKSNFLKALEGTLELN